MESREEDAVQVTNAARDIAATLGTELMKLLPALTAKYSINPQSFIIAAVQAAMKVGAGGVSSVAHMDLEESNSLEHDLNAVVDAAIRQKLPSLQLEHDRIWKLASNEGRDDTTLLELAKTFDRIEESLRDYTGVEE